LCNKLVIYSFIIKEINLNKKIVNIKWLLKRNLTNL